MEARPIINTGDSVEKVVDRCETLADPLLVEPDKNEQSVAEIKAPPLRLHPRGVFRFHSHEEANAWFENPPTRSTKKSS